eukprot:gnl/Dysnectes_brevis/3123_a3887_1253.p1 GENE.gnl/Dysnectes_brevis/3123_a3887_1253~~gnl/Dysnectes_brevis/3123_a3887_1253.p1  ORF type:complete len:234 (+),score=7.16 gnl/Dysnectes_brevis/3123_a3887_1253:61-762(+)
MSVFSTSDLQKLHTVIKRSIHDPKCSSNRSEFKIDWETKQIVSVDKKGFDAVKWFSMIKDTLPSSLSSLSSDPKVALALDGSTRAMAGARLLAHRLVQLKGPDALCIGLDQVQEHVPEAVIISRSHRDFSNPLTRPKVHKTKTRGDSIISEVAVEATKAKSDLKSPEKSSTSKKLRPVDDGRLAVPARLDARCRVFFSALSAGKPREEVERDMAKVGLSPSILDSPDDPVPPF